MNLVTNRIIEKRSLLPSSCIKVADWILRETKSVQNLTSQALANEVGVSQSTVVKFTQKIGYEGYSQFKIALIEELSRKEAVQIVHLHSNIHSDDSYSVIIQKLVKAKSESIMNTINALEIDNFAKAISLINNANRVQIVGMGSSSLAGKDLGYKLLKLGITTNNEFDSHVQIAVARTLKLDDVLIAISFSGKTKEVLVAVDVAKEKGVKVIALTSLKRSPLRERADICFTTSADELKNRSSSIAARTAQQTITDSLFVGLVKSRGEQGIELIGDISSQLARLS